MMRTMLVGGLLMAAALFGCGGEDGSETVPPVDRRARLQAAETWMYQISKLDEGNAIAVLAATDYPLLVLEPGHNHRPCTDFDPADLGAPGFDQGDLCANVYDTAAMIDQLRTTPGGTERLLIAYIDVGQAEWYRDYWVEGWEPPPVSGGTGTPDFILAADPDGWAGNFVVAYWDERWKELWLGTGASDGIIAELATLGFDGVYLDWVEAYDDERVQDAAGDLDPAEEMAIFVEQIGNRGREITPEFLVIAQNATYLIDELADPAQYAGAIDGLAVEDTWYYGDGSSENWNDGDGDTGDWDISDRLQCESDCCLDTIVAPDNVCPIDRRNTDTPSGCWDDSDPALEPWLCLRNQPVSGDLHGGGRHICEPGEEDGPNCWSTENRLAAYQRYLAQSVPVFSVDYVISEDKAAEVYAAARTERLRPIVTRVQLSQNTPTPPWDF